MSHSKFVSFITALAIMLTMVSMARPVSAQVTISACNLVDFNADSLSAGDNPATFFPGVTISSSVNTPMIFDSANPTGNDADLGTPNVAFGGPGNAEGDPSSGLSNTVPLGNLLIISEDNDASDPDDNAGGGTITFDFAQPEDVFAVEFIDADEASIPEVTAFDAAGNILFQGQGDAPGPNSYQEFIIDTEDVSSLEVFFPGSGAIAGVSCPPVFTAVSVASSGAVAPSFFVTSLVVGLALMSLSSLTFALLRRQK